MSNEGNDFAWANILVARGAWVLHVPTQVIGRAFGVYGPSESCTTHTLEVIPGHRFIATEENFIPLEEKESIFYESFQAGLSEVIRLVGDAGSKAGMPLPTAVRLLVSGLRSQANLLEAMVNREHNEPPRTDSNVSS